MNSAYLKPLRFLVSILFIFVVWQTAHLIGLTNRNLFPGPFDVAGAAVKLYEDGVLIKDLKMSMLRAVVGFSVGSVLGPVNTNQCICY